MEKGNYISDRTVSELTFGRFGGKEDVGLQSIIVAYREATGTKGRMPKKTIEGPEDEKTRLVGQGKSDKELQGGS